jgi:hypothetical protein
MNILLQFNLGQIFRERVDRSSSSKSYDECQNSGARGPLDPEAQAQGPSILDCKRWNFKPQDSTLVLQ